MLSATVDTRKWFLMQQHAEAVLSCHALHHRHQQHIVVDSQIGILEDGSQLKLVGSHLVVASLTGDTQFESDNLEFFHKRGNTLRDTPEIVVVHLLVFGRVVPHECTSCEQQVGTCRIESFIDKEILLFPS